MPHTVVQTPVVSTSMQRPVPGPPNAALLKTCTDLGGGELRQIRTQSITLVVGYTSYFPIGNILLFHQT